MLGHRATALFLVPSATTVVPVVVVDGVTRFSKIPEGFVNTQTIVIELHTDICDYALHPFTVSDS